MAIQINLLQNQKDYNKLDNSFHLARLAIVILGVACLITLIVVLGLKRNAQSSLSEAHTQRELLQKEINNLQDQEARIILINEKMTVMNEILEETPDYSRQVETFLAYVPVASDSAGINRISLEENNGEFIMAFPDILQLSEFLGTLESDEFKKNFTALEIEGIDLSNTGKALTLTLNVTF